MDLEFAIYQIERCMRLTQTQRTSILNTLRSAQSGARKGETEQLGAAVEIGRTPLRNNRSRAGARLHAAV
jgi:hypothetical protein